MGIDVFAPESKSEEYIAEAFEEFSHFVLHEEKNACIDILEKCLHRCTGSVGELQGGSDEYSIYRASFPTDDGEYDNIESRKTDNAALQLLNFYNEQKGRSNKFALTIEKIKRYMLGMCDRRSRERCCETYTSLGNEMFIMQFGGPTDGQVRHIDNMVPNVQICLYMSSRCPSTVVYAMDDGDGLPVTDGTSLIDFWERQNKSVPEIVKNVLLTHGDRKLDSKWYTKYFAWSWDTINLQLECFGKLYQPVAYQLGLETEPGTTLLAGGNEIHAGPPTAESRMFAFAIGIPEDDSVYSHQEDNNISHGDENNDGEVQYSPVLLHIDFCCLLFSIIDHEYKCNSSEESIVEGKHFLANVLIELIRDYPMKEYLLQIDEARVGIRTWLEKTLTIIENEQSTDSLVDEAVQSDVILYSPDVIKRRSKKKKSRSKTKKIVH
eukprot:CAMPEP_0183774034 /NCGR_PEP_ID=MMETSP0739-20130205/40814_1 /TAXON_ID=385413 /ORGANISM="Thalassiosira miniscula, Strain CCMP1093" /LENGTH=435 /DNA_ID=CAMNT_0026015205 /DNA_START=107 /DNA_END=1414 /DNA_ORIENTATION=+